MSQNHSGSGDDIGGDKTLRHINMGDSSTYIEGDFIQYGEHKVPRYLTQLPGLSVEILGRDNELKALHRLLHKSSKLVSINGMGGIGKTTTAIAFANRYKDEYAHIVWIEQLGEFAIDVASNIVLTTNLGITPSGDPRTDVLFILNTLSNLEGKSLLVIDNADEQLQQFKDDLPKAPEWHVLVTSRQELPFAEKMTLDFLSKDQALKLFYQYYDWDSNDDIAKHILETIDYHTLTIEILAKTAQNLEIKSLEKVASLLEERGIKIGKPVDFSTIAHSKKERTRYLFPYLEAIFQLQGISKSERYLLKQFIALPPIFFEWEEIITLLKIPEDEEVALDELILARNSLKKKGWLIYNERSPKNKEKIEKGEDIEIKEDTYKMHRIIQDVLKDNLNPTYESLKRLVSGISDLLHIDKAKDNPVDKFSLIIFGERILKVLPNPIQQGFIKLQSKLATVYSYMGEYDKAMYLYQLALQSHLQNFQGDHTGTATLRSNLASVYRDLGEYNKARDLQQMALESALQYLGKDHPHIAISRSKLALVYQRLGEHHKARNLLELALQSDLKNYGPNDPYTATRRSNLALVYRDLGEYSRARDLLELALKSDLQNFNEDHPSIAVRRSNLAQVYQALGEYTRARDLIELALQSDLKNFGEGHPSTAIRRISLALICRDQGEYHEAKDLLEVALKSFLQKFGEGHSYIAISRSNLATVYQKLGEYDKARNLLELALQSDLHNFGEDHPSTARRRVNLANVYEEQKEYPKARDLYQLALQSVIQKFGENHPATATIRSDLAIVYLRLGKYHRAKDLLEMAIQSDLQNLGEDHPSIATRRSNLATVYQSLGEYNKAKELFQKAYDSFRSLLGEQHPKTKTVKNWLDNLE